MKLFALQTIHLGKGPDGDDVVIATESEFTMDDVQEAERLIAIGAACDPDQRIVAMAPSDVALDALAAENVELKALAEEARVANEEFNVKHAELTAAIAAAHAEIDRLTTALAAANEKKAK
jgi:hypothetical protein